MATTAYKITVISQNSWHADGTAIIERACEHTHRTISGVVRCLRQKTKRHADGSWSAAWYHARVRHSDGSRLTDEEQGEVDGEMARQDREKYVLRG